MKKKLTSLAIAIILAVALILPYFNIEPAYADVKITQDQLDIVNPFIVQASETFANLPADQRTQIIDKVRNFLNGNISSSTQDLLDEVAGILKDINPTSYNVTSENIVLLAQAMKTFITQDKRQSILNQIESGSITNVSLTTDDIDQTAINDFDSQHNNIISFLIENVQTQSLLNLIKDHHNNLRIDNNFKVYYVLLGNTYSLDDLKNDKDFQDLVNQLLKDTNQNVSFDQIVSAADKFSQTAMQLSADNQKLLRAVLKAYGILDYTPSQNNGGFPGGGGTAGSGSTTTSGLIPVASGTVDLSKTTVISDQNNTIRLTIPAGIVADDGSKVEASISVLDDSTAKDITGKINIPGLTILGKLYTFSLKSIKDGNEKSITTFTKPVTVTLSLDGIDGSKYNLKKVSLFKIDENNTPICKGGKYDKKTNTLTTKLYGFSTYALMYYNKTFKDIPDNYWAKDDIEYMASKYIVRGETADKFVPSGNVTRAEFTIFLLRLLNVQPVTKASPFKDIKTGDWYYSDITTAYNIGLVSGISPDKFAPNSNITREEMAAMLVRALKLAGKDVTINADEQNAILSKYSDSSKISGWAKSVAAASIKYNLISGTSKDTFSPNSLATRAQAAAVTSRLFDMQ